MKVIEDTLVRHPKKGKVWLCQCSCGEITEATTVHLIHGNKKSCGCLAKENARKRRKQKPKTKPKQTPKRKVKTKTNEKTKNTKNSMNQIPIELKNIPSKMVENGLFQVFKNERIFRFNKHGAKECKIISINGYKTVNKMINGKQRQFYVHRLMAQAFVPNPENKPVVTFKDGDRSNTDINNLVWVTHLELKERSYQRKKHTLIKCKMCGKLTKNSNQICSFCAIKIKEAKNKEENKKRRIKEIIENVSEIRLDYLTPKQREIIELSLEGKSIIEISRIKGVSRQHISATIQRARKRSNKKLNRIELLNKKDNQKEEIIQKTNDLKDLRILHGLTLRDVAEHLGISSQAYSNKEKGNSEFTTSEAIKLTELFDKSFEDLFI